LRHLSRIKDVMMQHSRFFRFASRAALTAGIAVASASLAPAAAQEGAAVPSGPEISLTPEDPRAGITSRSTPPRARAPRFLTRADSLVWVRAKAAAHTSNGFRIIVSSFDRTLWVVAGRDTVFSAPVAVAAEGRLSYAGRTWTFQTPRGQRQVLRKEKDPVWIPPDWHYAETARDHGLKLGAIPAGGVTLSGARRLVVRDSLVGLILPGKPWQPLPLSEQIVFDGTLYIPPLGTKNRRIEGELGKFRLDMGNGYLLHGTPYKDSIGLAVTHGCVRLDDEDIEWLYTHIPVGTRVFIY
jgi:hypothetical protein